MKLLLALAALCCVGSVVNGYIINCYYGTWAAYRPGNGLFEPGNIDPFLCTHISYSFFGLNDDGTIRSLDEWLDFDNGKGFISKTIALKQQNPNLKVLAVVGGWNEGSARYSSMAADAGKRSTFVRSALNLVNEHGFDGFDLDWEYPAIKDRGGSPEDKWNFVTLLSELKQALSVQGKLLGIAVAATEATASQSYDIPAVAANVDFINVMTYDLSGSWDPVTGFNAPLHGNGVNNVEDSINYWLRAGAPASKLLLGTGFYGRTFTLANGNEHGVGAPITGPGAAGPYTRENGYLGYNEICEDINSWNTVWDNVADDPYGWKSNQWVGYDNPDSIAIKMDFLKSKGLGGAMLWSLETDDFRGNCGQRYPLLSTINNSLGRDVGNNPTQAPTQAPTQGPTQGPTNAPTAPPSGGDCGGGDGFYSGDNNAYCSNAYYRCAGGIKYYFNCPEGLCFDSSFNGCGWP